MSENLTGNRVVVRSDKRVEIEAFAPRPPERNEILIQTLCTLVSAGTELGSMELHDESAADYSPGYSNVGRVLEAGADVTDYRAGDVVLSLDVHATHVTVPAVPQRVAPVPEKVTPKEAAFGALGGVSMHAVRKARVELGEYVAVTGMGVVGQLALQLLAHTGCEALVAIDLSEFRLDVARAHGATHAVNPQSCDLGEAINTITNGHGVDCIIEATGNPQLLPTLFGMCRVGGRVLLLGGPGFHRVAEMIFASVYEKELTLVGVHAPKCPTTETPYFPWTQQYNRREVLKMIADGRLNVRPLITHVLPFNQASEAYRLLREEKDKALGVILDFRNTA